MLKEHIDELRSAEQDRLRLMDLWSFQSGEIEGAAIADAEEDARLETEKRVLSNAERLFTAATAAQEMLYEGEVSAESLLGGALKQVEDLARFDEQFRETAQQLATGQGECRRCCGDAAALCG